MEEWKEYTLEELSIGKGSYGIGAAAVSYDSSLYTYLRITDINDDGSLNKTGLMSVNDSDAGKYLLKPNDIVFARTGNSTGRSYFYDGSDGDLVYAGFLIKFSLNPEIVNPRILKYYTHSSIYYDWVRSFDTGGTRGNINAKTYGNMPIVLPPRSIQDKIVSILKSLDDKIENNRKINENLEQQAQALFKFWFVDFEPFRDQPFVESELGMIPEGWRVDVFDSIIKDIIPGDWGKEKEEGNYTHKVACIRGCDFQDIKNGLRGKTPERYILEKNYTAKRFQDHDVLVEISGGTPTISTGRVCPISQKLIELYDSDIVCTNFCKVIRPMKGYGAFLYYSWLYKFNNKVMFGYENGTSGIKNFRLKDFTSIEPVVIPPLKEIERFQELIDTIHLQIQTRGTESSRLSHLRDTLLPKLMSGEITL